MKRRPFVLANWKMAMTISEGKTFTSRFLQEVHPLERKMDIVICPPYTALYALYRVLGNTSVELGAQDVCAAQDEAHTGQISAPLLADVGCRWVMLGHWEVRRQRSETDIDISKKINSAILVGIRPILLIGEGIKEQNDFEATLSNRLRTVFSRCLHEQVARAVVVYGPEWAIGGQESAPPGHISSRCASIRRWFREEYGEDVAGRLRIIYGGSVTPENTRSLLDSPELDGLGVGKNGRDPAAFARIVSLIAEAKGIGPS